MSGSFADALARSRAMYASGEDAGKRALSGGSLTPLTGYPPGEAASFYLGYWCALRFALDVPRPMADGHRGTYWRRGTARRPDAP